MKEAIKSRIETVRRGEVPEGYIMENHQLRPVEWDYEKIGPYLNAYDEYSNDTERYPLATSSRQGLMLQSEYYNDQRYDETAGGFHIVPVGYITYRHMSDDDIFRFNVNDMNKPILVSPEYPVFTTTYELNRNLLVTYLNGMKEFRAYSSSQKKGSTRTRMYFSRLGEFSMPIPPLTEQQKIAEILAACDKVIELKQTLIEEKRRQKKWLMQKLLMPQKAWKKTTIGQIAKVTTGATPDTKHPEYWNGEIRWMSSGELNLKHVFEVEGRITDLGLRKSGTKLIPASCILIGLAGQGKTRGTVAINHVELCTNQSIAAVHPSEHYISEYLYHYLDSKYLELRKISSGDGARGGLNLDIIAGFVVYFPDNTEQRRIASILTASDDEISLLEQELTEWQQKKKALMQLLLTGLMRVKI